MGKGKRAHTISIPSIPSINLSAPKTSFDHSFSVSPPSFFQKHNDAKQNTLLSTQTITEIETQQVPKRWTPPRKPKRYDDLEHKMEAAPLYVLVLTYLNYFVLILFGHMRDILGKVFKAQAYVHLKTVNVSLLIS